MEYSSTEHVVSWFRDRYREASLVIKPPYQRNPVWTARKKCRLVETILLGLPIPEIYVRQATTPDGDTTYELVDGQQRIRTVLQFVGFERDDSELENNNFVLDKLSVTSQFYNRGFADLSNDEKIRFYSYAFAVRNLKNTTEAEVRDMFRRLNESLTPLNAQELRNAIYSGPFARQAVILADLEYWAENTIVSAAQIRRMVDVELVAELLIGVMHGPQSGASQIDKYYLMYEDFEDEFPEQRATRRRFEETLATIREVLPDIKGVRWSNKADFYTLFVGLARLLRTGELRKEATSELRIALLEFAREVSNRLSNDRADVRAEAIDYVRAIEKGVNEKSRRAARQGALIKIIQPYFMNTQETKGAI